MYCIKLFYMNDTSILNKKIEHCFKKGKVLCNKFIFHKSKYGVSCICSVHRCPVVSGFWISLVSCFHKSHCVFCGGLAMDRLSGVFDTVIYDGAMCLNWKIQGWIFTSPGVIAGSSLCHMQALTQNSILLQYQIQKLPSSIFSYKISLHSQETIIKYFKNWGILLLMMTFNS